MEEILEKMSEQLAARVFEKVAVRIDAAFDARLRGMAEILWLEEEAAVLMKCSAQKLADLRKEGLIDHTTNPAGRPAYMLHHLLGYLMGLEVKNGKQAVGLADVLQFRLKEAA